MRAILALSFFLTKLFLSSGISVPEINVLFCLLTETMKLHFKRDGCEKRKQNQTATRNANSTIRAKSSLLEIIKKR